MRSELSHLLMRHRAYENRKRREEIHLIGIRNEIRGAMGGDRLEHEDIYGSTSTSQETNKGEQARKEVLRRMDFDDTEQLAPEDMSDLTE